ncbi:MAG TPA: PLP-dependent aminotransferase family protein [Longimicrobiales bacterium]
MDLHIILRDRRRITAEVYRQVRAAILDGRLKPHQALPSSRDLARRLEVSRNTVVLAYERLRAEGFVTSRAGAGTYVDEVRVNAAPAGPSESPLRPRGLWHEIPPGRDMAALEVPFDFRSGIPDAAAFPYAAWRARLNRQFQPRSVGKGAHIEAAGDPGLRSAIARHIGTSRAVRTAADNILITSGSQQAVDLIARVLLEPGDTVAVEDPGYPLTQRALRAYGCTVVGVPVDEEGVVVDAVPGTARLIHVTPSHQYPLGMTLSMRRRRALLEWAGRHDAAIIEDDYDSEFRYHGRSLEPLQCLDDTGRVLYVGSFSKVMLPTLRLGFVVAPAPLCDALRKAKYLADWHTPAPIQTAAAAFIDDGLLSHHIRRMRRAYAERHDRIVQLLARDFSGLLTPLPSYGGLHLAALLAEGYDTGDHVVAERALARGVAVFPLSYHYLSTPPRHGFLFGYGAIAAGDIEEGLRRLRSCL